VSGMVMSVVSDRAGVETALRTWGVLI
jgi:hypothetical protein